MVLLSPVDLAAKSFINQIVTLVLLVDLQVHLCVIVVSNQSQIYLIYEKF